MIRKGKVSTLERILNKQKKEKETNSDSDSEFYEENRVKTNVIEQDKDQQDIVKDLVHILESRVSTANFSHTGFGKTAVAFYLAKKMNLNIVIFYPAGSAIIWSDHAKMMNYTDKINIITSLGLASANKEYNLKHILENNRFNTVESDFCDIKNTTEDKRYIWNDKRCKKVFSNTLIVIDESHKITTNSEVSKYFLELYKYLLSEGSDTSKFKKWNCYWYMQSATIAEKIERYKRILYMLGIIQDESKASFKRFLNHCKEEAEAAGITSEDDAVLLKRYLKSRLVPYVVSAKSPKYPFKNNVRVELFDLDKETTKKIEATNQEIASIIKNKTSGGLSAVQGARKNIKAWMIPLYVALCKALVEKGYAVAIFMSFLHTIHELGYQLREYKPIILTGEVSDKNVRDKYQRQFREGKIKVMILFVGVGSTSISLHDTVSLEEKKANPKLRKAHASLLLLTYCMIDFIQMVRRLYRKGVKSDTLQILPLVNRTCHKSIALNIVSKMFVIEKFNDDVPRSETIFQAITGFEKKIEYNDINDTVNLSTQIHDIIPDITLETLTEKPIVENMVSTTTTKMLTSSKDMPFIKKPKLFIKKIHSNEYHISGNTLNYKDLIKPISHYWNSDLKVWIVNSTRLSKLVETLKKHKVKFEMLK